MSPCRITLVFGARPAISAAAAFPALFSSMKLMVELITSNAIMPTKSCQSGGLPCIGSLKTQIMREFEHFTLCSPCYVCACMYVCERKSKKAREETETERRDVFTPPFAKAMAMMAAASITQDRGFHIKHKNFRNLFSCFRIGFKRSII